MSGLLCIPEKMTNSVYVLDVEDFRNPHPQKIKGHKGKFCRCLTM